MSIHVVIAGGGLGGLCLAQGLRKAGMSVAVYEREPHATAEQGYRIHINQAGSGALHTCLPPAQWDAFVATAGQPCAGLGFVTEQLRELMFIAQHRIERRPPGAPAEPAASEHPVSRVALRRVLLGGLDGAIHFGTEVVGFTADAGGVTVQLADGSTARGDLLVAADGVGSRVRQQHLPHAEVEDTGIVAIGGKLALDGAARGWLPEPLWTRLNNVVPPGGCGMFIAPYVRKPAATHLPPDGLTDHVFWAFLARRERYPCDADVRTLDGVALHGAVLAQIEAWHTDLRRLVAESDPHTVAAFRIQSAVPVARWPTTRVTLLGDAIHAMTPLQGLGGNTAFRDAHLLCQRLIDVDQGRAELLPAVASYEHAMRGYGFDAVRRSRKVGELAVSDGRFGRAMFKAVLRVVDRVPPLKHRMFAAPSAA